ncbi:MAG: UDP-N-acetylmuramoyl-tripeptide--D-alanyl-D-alanine ligase, partial [Chloroflexi bacterium]|nr:UDP-N-acetylmuramoyl-tripeptide--D-alanyl-D-alanine ligase [Chloroflexota bacterium]
MTTEDRYTLRTLLTDLGLREPLAGAEVVALGGVAIDSRTVQAGNLFVALPGERTDGHAYVEDAFGAGAAAALVSRAVDGHPVVDVASGARPDAWRAPIAVRVADTLSALQRAAGARRLARPDLRVVGVTGSVGKTTTKEAVSAVLAGRFATLHSAGNRNNEIGLPLTLMGLRAEHRVAVLEMGMYDLGEIATLCEIARPQVGVVTNVGPVHLERLGTMERIAQAKGELLAALPEGGVAVLNGDDPRVAAMPTPGGVHRLTYGLGAENDVRATRVVGEGLGGVRFAAEVSACPEL